MLDKADIELLRKNVRIIVRTQCGIHIVLRTWNDFWVDENISRANIAMKDMTLDTKVLRH